jgi:hypothetical protein
MNCLFGAASTFTEIATKQYSGNIAHQSNIRAALKNQVAGEKSASVVSV